MAFACDATKLRPGSIVLVEHPVGPSGRPTYPHFFIVMQLPESLNVGDQIPCLGVTSRISAAAFDPELHLPMRWLNRKGGDPTTGFTKPCAASVVFRHTLMVKSGDAYPIEVEARHEGKFIKSDHFQSLVAMLNAYNRKLLLRRPPRQPPNGA